MAFLESDPEVPHHLVYAMAGAVSAPIAALGYMRGIVGVMVQPFGTPRYLATRFDQDNRRLALSRGGRCLAVASYDRGVEIFDSSSGTRVGNFTEPSEIQTVDVLDDSGTVLVGSDADGVVVVSSDGNRHRLGSMDCVRVLGDGERIIGTRGRKRRSLDLVSGSDGARLASRALWTFGILDAKSKDDRMYVLDPERTLCCLSLPDLVMIRQVRSSHPQVWLGLLGRCGDGRMLMLRGVPNSAGMNDIVALSDDIGEGSVVGKVRGGWAVLVDSGRLVLHESGETVAIGSP